MLVNHSSKSQFAQLYSIANASLQLENSSRSFSSRCEKHVTPCTLAAPSVSKIRFMTEKSLSAISVCECLRAAHGSAGCSGSLPCGWGVRLPGLKPKPDNVVEDA